MIRLTALALSLYFAVGAPAYADTVNYETRLASQTNQFDRVFMIRNTDVWERRWDPQANEWIWIEHSDLSSELSARPNPAGGFVPGPMICNSAEALCRLYIRTRLDGLAGAGAVSDPVSPSSTWLMYTFERDRVDYSDASAFNLPAGYSPYIGLQTECISNLAVDELFDLHCLRQWSLRASSSTLNGHVEIQRYSVDLAFEDRSDSHSGAIRSNLDWINAAEEINRRPCITNRGVFVVAGAGIMQTTWQNDKTIHSRSYHNYADVGPGFESNCQFWQSGKKRLRGRRFSQNKSRWLWDNNGRPTKKRNIDSEVIGSLRRSESERDYVLLQRKGGRVHVYERFLANNGWAWADHGFPEAEDIREIGWVQNGMYFVRTASGNLYQKEWRGDLNRWAWVNHGTP